MFVVFDEILQARIKGEKWPNHTKQSPKAKKKHQKRKCYRGKTGVPTESHIDYISGKERET
jgi:hypothetical protein